MTQRTEDRTRATPESIIRRDGDSSSRGHDQVQVQVKVQETLSEDLVTQPVEDRNRAAPDNLIRGAGDSVSIGKVSK